jgi:hypothetical protein
MLWDQSTLGCDGQPSLCDGDGPAHSRPPIENRFLIQSVKHRQLNIVEEPAVINVVFLGQVWHMIGFWESIATDLKTRIMVEYGNVK